MSKNYEDYDYETEETNNNSGIVKKVLIFLLILIAIIIIIFLLKSCGKHEGGTNDPTPEIKTNYEDTLIEAAKKYFDNDYDAYPQTAGECTQVYLTDLVEKNLLDSNTFATCNKNGTYVRVCILTNGSKQYTPWLSCGDRNSENEYGSLKEGTNNDVIANKTYVEFKFLPQVLKASGTTLGKVEELWKSDITYSSYKTLKTTKYYRFRDKLYTWKVGIKSYYTNNGETNDVKKANQYYTTEPSKSYALYDNKTTEAYKWYTKSYALKNGSKDFSTTAIGEYKEKGEAVPVTKYRTAKTYTTYNPYLYHACVEGNDPKGPILYSEIECKNRPSNTYKTEKGTVYACRAYGNDSVTVQDKIVEGANSTCYNVTAWNSITDNACDINSQLCQAATTYLYTWYKKSYYPSGATTASGEKTYFTESPVKDALKDESTKATAYKWYRLTETTTSGYTATAPSGYDTATKTSDYKWSDWSDWSTTNPKVTDGRSRTIETKSKIKLQQIIGTSESSWTDLSNDYVSKEDMIKIFNENKYAVNSLEDINENGEIRYQTKMYVRNKKETN